MTIMGTYSRLFAMVICLSLIALTNAFGQAEIDDSQMRESAAARIMKAHDIEIDWRNTSLLEITNIEMRLNTVERIKREHGISFDWRKKSLLELTDAEARLNAVERIKREHGVTFDWEKTSLLQLTDAEARMNTARRISTATSKPLDWTKHSLEDLSRMESGLSQASTNPGTVTLSFDVLFPPANQNAMGLHKLTQAEREELRKHVETLLITVVQASTQQPASEVNVPYLQRATNIPNNLIMVTGTRTQKVEYIADSIAEKTGKYIRLLGGSSWVLTLPTLALVTDDIIIVFQELELKDNKKAQIAVAYVDGDEIIVKHVGGSYVSQSGYLTTVLEVLGEGAVLKLADGSYVSVPEYDQYDTGWWLPPYKALMTSNKMYLYNLKKGKRVWINPR